MHTSTQKSREHSVARTPELPELDRLIHERIRLGIVSALATNDSLSFNDLKRVLKTTDGNLSVHARKLEEAQYISCVNFSKGGCREPNTAYRHRPAGAGRVSGSDGGVDPGDAEGVEGPFFCAAYFVLQSSLQRSDSMSDSDNEP